MRYVAQRRALLVWLCSSWLSWQPPASGTEVHSNPKGHSRGALSVGRLSGVFTVADFTTINGSSVAAGWLTANLTDTAGKNEIGKFTNFPVRVPVSGVLSGAPIEVSTVDNPVILPELSTNTCLVLGIVVGAVDLTIPGLGLNLHVNEISLVVRADRETTVGDILCTLLGDDLLGAPVTSDGSGTRTPHGNSLAQTSSTRNLMRPEQLRGLVEILLGTGISKATPANAESSVKSSVPTKTDPAPGLLQNLLQRAILTMDPSALQKPKRSEPAKPAVP